MARVRSFCSSVRLGSRSENAASSQGLANFCRSPSTLKATVANRDTELMLFCVEAQDDAYRFIDLRCRHVPDSIRINRDIASDGLDRCLDPAVASSATRAIADVNPFSVATCSLRWSERCVERLCRGRLVNRMIASRDLSRPGEGRDRFPNRRIVFKVISVNAIRPRQRSI